MRLVCVDARFVDDGFHLAHDVSRVVCSNVASFAVFPARDLSKSGKGAKASKPSYRAGEPLTFTLDDSRELMGWVNDLSAVYRALTSQSAEQQAGPAAGAHAEPRASEAPLPSQFESKPVWASYS